MTIFGQDASDYDYSRGPMNMDVAHKAGVNFFTYKATEGTSLRHKHYGECLNRAKTAGIEFLGAYIVPRSGPAVSAQVDYFLAYVNAATPWWTSYPGFFFQVDTEKWGYDQVSSKRGADVCAEIRKRTGRQVVHYAPSWAYGNTIPQPDPLWASSYGTNGVGTLQNMYPGDKSPRWAAYSGRTPTFLQFGSNIVIGTQHNCDGNAFRGTMDDLRKFITGSSISPEGDDDMTPQESAMLHDSLVILTGLANGVDTVPVHDKDGVLSLLPFYQRVAEEVVKLSPSPSNHQHGLAGVTGPAVSVPPTPSV